VSPRFSVGAPTFALLVLALLAGGMGTARPASAQRVTVSTSGQYASGDYIFTEQTDLFAWTTGIGVSRGRLYAGASIPLIVQSTPWVSYTGGGFTPSGGPQHATVGGGRRGPQRGRRAPVALPDTGSYRRTGLGDPQLRLAVDVLRPDPSGISVQVTGALKPPLADADAGFSTGAWDGGLGVVASRSFRGWLVIAEGTYWWLGDLEALRLRDGLTYSLAVGQMLAGGRWGLLASIAGSTRVIDDVDPPVSVNGGLSFLPGPWGVSATVSAGLSEGAADWSVGLGTHVTFGQ